MREPDEATVRRDLGVGDRSPSLRTAISDAWKTTLSDYPHRAWWRRKATSASIMWEHSVQNATVAFASDRGCRVVPHNDTRSFVFDQSTLVRFKKADIELKSRNYPTFTATLFHNHEAELPGFEDLHRVEAAYVLNDLQTAIEWIGIVARHKNDILWHFELGAPAVVEELLLGTHELRPAAERVIRPKAPPSSDQVVDKK